MPDSVFLRFKNLLEHRPNLPLFSFVDERGRETEQLTPATLFEEGMAIAYHIRHKIKIQPGERVLLAYPQESLDFVKAFTGCLFAGVIPVPVAPPNPLQLESSLPIFRSIAEDCGAVAILTNGLYTRLRQLARLKQFLRKGEQWTDLTWHRTDIKLPKLDVNTRSRCSG